jgi:methylated-DNA-[protein]-cysteine S-methyltransferase
MTPRDGLEIKVASPSAPARAEADRVLLDSPLGPLLVTAREGFLVGLRFDASVADEPDTPRAPELEAAAAQLGEYFAGARRRFELPLRPSASALDRRVLDALARIPYGQTMSYGELTAELGLPGDEVRKVGGAIGRNPLPILIPCHRVIGADGGLVGYGGGLARKAQLLALEAPQLQLGP